MYILKRKELAQVLACAKSASATADCVSRLLLPPHSPSHMFTPASNLRHLAVLPESL